MTFIDLDIKTLSVVFVIYAFIFSLGLFLLQSVQKKVSGLSWFSFSILVIGLGSVMLSVKGEVPDFIGIIMSNLTIAYGFHLILYSLVTFRGYTYRVLHYNRMILFAMFIGFLYFTYYEPSFKNRVIVISLYLALVTDAYSKQIMGYKLDNHMKTSLCSDALAMAIKNRKYPKEKLIHHSDRGFQYCNPKYTEFAEKNGIIISMTEQYDPYENAVAERINRTLKYEYGLKQIIKNTDIAQEMATQAVDIYNNLSDKDFIHKLNIGQKEMGETIYWLELLKETGYISENQFLSINVLVHFLQFLSK